MWGKVALLAHVKKENSMFFAPTNVFDSEPTYTYGI